MSKSKEKLNHETPEFWIREVEYFADACAGAEKGLSVLRSMLDHAKQKLSEFSPKPEEVNELD